MTAPAAAAAPPCVYCGHAVGPWVTTTDVNRRTSGETYLFVRCTSCGLIRLANPPADLSTAYPRGYVAQPTEAQFARIAARTRYQIEMVQQHVRGGRLLEIGPGFGAFLRLARQAGFEPHAIEVDPDTCRFLEATVGARVTQSGAPHDVLREAGPEYDAIVLWHSIEHLPDPFATVSAAAARLRPGGCLLVATPNPQAWQLSRMGAAWPHIDAPRHLWLIPFEVLREQATRTGLALATVTSDDPGGRSWNVFGWSQALLNAMPRAAGGWRAARVAARLAGELSASLLAGVERRPLAGAAYTAVFLKPAQADV